MTIWKDITEMLGYFERNQVELAIFANMRYYEQDELYRVSLEKTENNAKIEVKENGATFHAALTKAYRRWTHLVTDGAPEFECPRIEDGSHDQNDNSED
jgi:hypothetical protein